MICLNRFLFDFNQVNIQRETFLVCLTLAGSLKFYTKCLARWCDRRKGRKCPFGKLITFSGELSENESVALGEFFNQT